MTKMKIYHILKFFPYISINESKVRENFLISNSYTLGKDFRHEENSHFSLVLKLYKNRMSNSILKCILIYLIFEFEKVLIGSFQINSFIA